MDENLYNIVLYFQAFFFLIQRILCTQVSDTGPLVLCCFFFWQTGFSSIKPTLCFEEYSYVTIWRKKLRDKTERRKVYSWKIVFLLNAVKVEAKNYSRKNLTLILFCPTSFKSIICKKKTISICCRTCFSTGDLGVQVSVRLSVRPFVRPFVNIYPGWAQLLL